MIELTDKQKKGIDLSVKSLRKKFPFVKGWEPDNDNEVYLMSFFINLFIDFFEMSEFYGKETRRFWVDMYNKYGAEEMVSHSLVSFIETDDDKPIYDTPLSEEMYKQSDKIQNQLNTTYDMLPNEYKILVETPFNDGGSKNITISKYKQYQ